MVRHFVNVLEEEIEEAFFYPSDLVNTKTTMSLGVGGERWIYTLTVHVSVYIHHYSPPLLLWEKMRPRKKLLILNKTFFIDIWIIKENF